LLLEKAAEKAQKVEQKLVCSSNLNEAAVKQPFCGQEVSEKNFPKSS
jgi:hypothetical protein